MTILYLFAFGQLRKRKRPKGKHQGWKQKSEIRKQRRRLWYHKWP